MAWLWLHSLILLAVTFTGGLWLGRAISALTTQRVPAPRAESLTLDEETETYPAYHGTEPVHQPEPVPAVAEPIAVPPAAVEPEPLPPAPPPPVQVVPEPIIMPVAAQIRVRATMLFPVNQFGVITITQAPDAHIVAQGLM